MAFSCMKVVLSNISITTTTPNIGKELLIKQSMFRKISKTKMPSFHGTTTMRAVNLLSSMKHKKSGS